MAFKIKSHAERQKEEREGNYARIDMVKGMIQRQEYSASQELEHLMDSKSMDRCITLFSILFDKVTALEKQVESQQKTLDFVLEKILEDEIQFNVYNKNNKNR